TSWLLAGDLESGRAFIAGPYQRPLTATIVHVLCSELPTSARVRLLREIDTIYSERVHARLSWTRGIMEPTLIWILGLLVGLTVFALFLPLVKLVQSLT